MIPKMPAPHLDSGVGTGFSGKIMLKTKRLDREPIQLNRIMIQDDVSLMLRLG